jgi:hypothetical protein
LSEQISVFLRAIPEAYRGPGFDVVRNNVYERAADGTRRLVTQLEPFSELRL